MTACTWALAEMRRATSLARYLTSSRSSLSSGGAIQASGRSFRESRLASSVASSTSFFTRLESQWRPSGWTRCTWAPSASNRSAAQYQPYVASSATSGSWPALAIASASWSGSLTTRTVSSTSPSSLILTITERRRCRSIPTYCRWCSTGVSFRFRVGLETPSVPCTFGSRRREELRRFAGDSADRATTTDPVLFGGRAPHNGDRSRRSGAALLHQLWRGA